MSAPFSKESFEQKFVKSDGCWEWLATKNQDGYGRVKQFGVLKSAHRVSYELYKGPLNGLQVLHKCDNPSCVNPDHLFLGSIQDNATDKKLKGRAVANRMPGESHPSHKLTDEIVASIYLDKEFSQNHLATFYDVSQAIIWKIKNKKAWKHLTDTL